jgi:hypothetical protein
MIPHTEVTSEGERVPPRRRVPHYHGGEVRVIFVVSALVLIVAQSTGANLPLSTAGAVVVAALLVIAAGITDPSQAGIHWLDAFLSIFGTLLFGTSAVSHYRAGLSVFDTSFASTEALALLSLIALFFTTRTIRGSLQKKNLS